MKAVIRAGGKNSRVINGGFFVLPPEVVAYVAGDAILSGKEPLEKLPRDSRRMAFEHEGFRQPMDTLRDWYRLVELRALDKAQRTARQDGVRGGLGAVA